ATVGATGTLEPVDAIDVGAQVVGRIDHFGLDPRCSSVRDQLAIADGLPLGPHLLLAGLWPTRLIDFGSPVEEDTILAQIDPRLYQVQFDRAKANLATAKAELRQMYAKRGKAKVDWDQASELFKTKSVSVADHAAAWAVFEEIEALIDQKRAAISK